MTTPTSPLENALVIAAEAIERALASAQPGVSATSAEVVQASPGDHRCLVSGIGDGVLAIDTHGDPQLDELIAAQLPTIAAFIAEDLGAALDRPIELTPTTGDQTTGFSQSLQADLAGFPTPSQVLVAVDTVLAATIGDIVRERLQHLDNDAAPAAGTPADTQTPVEVLNADFPQMGGGIGGAGHQDLSLLNDVQLAITVELGRTTMRVRDLLELGAGSVVELDRSAGTPVDVLVNGTIVARGEVVVVDDELGVRVTEVVQNDAGVPV